MTKNLPYENPDKPDFRPVAFALEKYLKSRSVRHKGNRSSMGFSPPKTEQCRKPKEQS